MLDLKFLNDSLELSTGMKRPLCLHRFQLELLELLLLPAGALSLPPVLEHDLLSRALLLVILVGLLLSAHVCGCRSFICFIVAGSLTLLLYRGHGLAGVHLTLEAPHPQYALDGIQAFLPLFYLDYY